MTTFDATNPVLIIRDNTGRIIGCCARHCYDSEDFRCNCICGGVNHAVGRRQAAQNVLDGITIDWKATFAKVPQSQCRVIIPRGTYRVASQLTLFDTEPETDQETRPWPHHQHQF
jgi:hypothetical protein